MFENFLNVSFKGNMSEDDFPPGLNLSKVSKTTTRPNETLVLSWNEIIK